MNDGLSLNDIPAGNKPLSSKERFQIMQICREVADLQNHPGWKHLEEIANRMIRQATPKISEFGAEDAVKIASKAVYVTGIQDLLSLPKQKQKELSKLESSGLA